MLPSKKITVQPNRPPTICCGRSQVSAFPSLEEKSKSSRKRFFCKDNVLTTFEQDFHSGSYQDEELVQDIGREVEKI